MIWAYAIIGFIALQRLSELVYSRRNTGALLARGAVEFGASHYPVMVLLHASWFVAVFLALPDPLAIHGIAVGVLVLMQASRLWVMAALGPYWTTRVITLPDAPLVTTGPYRFLRHPNYAIVAIEIAALPLAFGEMWVAAIYSILNAAMLFWRIRTENMALAARRALAPHEA